MFDFKTFEETMFYITTFFTDSTMEFPRIELNGNNICMKPDNLTDIEQILITKMLMHSLPHRNAVFSLEYQGKVCHML